MAKYKYYNRRPDKSHRQDCVCRAISTGTNLHYDAVQNLLTLTSQTYKCDELCVCCYHHLLEDILCYVCQEVDFDETVKALANRYPRNRLIIRVDSHLTCAINGTVLDIWDCSNELVDCFWIVD